jgi:hypothetical protein
MIRCLNCCQALVTILFCFVCCSAWSGPDARYGAGNSERAVPKYDQQIVGGDPVANNATQSSNGGEVKGSVDAGGRANLGNGRRGTVSWDGTVHDNKGGRIGRVCSGSMDFDRDGRLVRCVDAEGKEWGPGQVQDNDKVKNQQTLPRHEANGDATRGLVELQQKSSDRDSVTAGTNRNRLEKDDSTGNQNAFCETQKMISKKDANKIAYGKMGQFSSFCGVEKELAVLCNRNGKIQDHKIGDRNSNPGGMPLRTSTFIHMHNHPFNAYANWPSKLDVENVYRIKSMLVNFLKDQGCNQQLINERECYHYIVVCSCEGKAAQLLRYDLTAVFLVGDDGSETVFPRPDFVDDNSLSHLWPPGHEPFRYGAKDVARVKAELQKGNAETSGALGAVTCWCEIMGVRGWCKCDPHERGIVYHVGEGVHTRNRLILIGDYEYSLCRRCGRVIQPSGPEDGHHGITDQRIVQAFEKRRTRGMTTSQIEALNEQMGGMLRQANEKLLSMPDGSVIASGLCRCQIPDPIQVGWGMTDEDDFYVCNFCGRIREPDHTGGMPLGPTMMHEMGLMEQENKIWKRISQLAETNEIDGK